MTSSHLLRRFGPVQIPACLLVLATVAAMAGQPSTQNELISRLRQGGYVLVMRHASSPREAPSKDIANADNLKLERQLDEGGRRSATTMGDVIRALQIPIGVVLTSPTYRAMETVRLARLASPTTVTELGDGGQSMQEDDRPKQHVDPKAQRQNTRNAIAAMSVGTSAPASRPIGRIAPSKKRPSSA